jgi:hypothetical protein
MIKMTLTCNAAAPFEPLAQRSWAAWRFLPQRLRLRKARGQ